jgi:RimJ/RimL family protein N-acetyltransferase
VLDWAFGGAGLVRVVAETYEHNLASRRVMTKLGMRLVRRFRLDAEALGEQLEWEGDEVGYEVTAEQWGGAGSAGAAGAVRQDRTEP